MVAGETAGDLGGKMIKENIDKIFKDKLAEYETPVDPALWAGIEKELDGGEVLPFGVVPAAGTGKRAILNWRKAAYYGVSVAALLIIGLFLFKGGKQQQVTVSVEKDMVAENIMPENNIAAVRNIAATGNVVAAENDDVAEDMIPENMSVAENVSAAEKSEVSANVESSEKSKAAEKVESSEKSKAAEKVESSEKSEASENVVVPEKNNGPENSGATHKDEVAAENGQDVIYVGNDRVKRGRREYTLALASNFISSNSVSVSPQYLNYMSLGSVASGGMYSVEQISETQYSLPLNVGLQAQVKVNNLLSVGLGLNYTLLKSKYDALINKRYYHIKQNLHYIGVPVNLYFNLVDKKNFFFYANVGGAVEKGINASYRITSYDALTHRTNADMDGFQYSANLGFGMEYRFIPLMGLYLEPNLVYYFNSDIPASIRTDQPVQVKAEIGFRFHINNK